MTLTWDKTWSAAIYRATKRSKTLRPLAMFCATILLFVMITAVAMTYAGADPMETILGRLGASIFTLGIPLCAAWLASYVLQHVVRRVRPFDSGQGEPLITMTWTGPSFPSAHAAIACATAAVGLIVFPDIYGPWLFIGATLVSLGRVMVGVHYLLDVLVGAVIGMLVGSATLMGYLFLIFNLFPH